MILRFCHLLYTRSQDHRTALHESARQGDVETSRWLLAAGADLLAMDLNNDTPDALVPIGSLCKNLFDQHRATVTILENIGALDVVVHLCDHNYSFGRIGGLRHAPP